MAPRLHPTTVRLTDAEQTFLADLKIPGATTTSDKIRHLINERKRSLEAGRDFGAALSLANSMLLPLSTAVKTAENEAGVHSQLVRRLLDWAPELIATLLTEAVEDDADEEQLKNLELALSHQLIRVLDLGLQLYVSRETSLYDASVLGPERIASLRRLCRMANDDSEAE